mmetsp:Transcript_45919/g.106757  ORF Transcript_45919/g.106757 Transcript_45919/m.106757 type:complete len:391 (+) Transcript_45919:70-1242(+)
MQQGGLGATGQQHAEDCTFPAGKVAGAPLVVSWLIVIFTVFQILEAVKPNSQFPTWMMVLRVVGNQVILYSSVLVHELGHGSMARYLGGSIWKILLWPFGGICFSHHPETDDATTSLKNNLKIVVAGPATHFPQTSVWILFLLGFEACIEVYRQTRISHMLLPFAQPRVFLPAGGLFQQLLYEWILWGIQINVMSFFFNVFFPMYPMDCAKILVCSLQLCCRVSARTAALVLICCAIPCALLLLGAAVYAWYTQGPLASITGYIGVMAIADALKIWRLRNERRLHLHPLFMNARSATRDVHDDFGSTTRRLNTDDLDDEPPSAEMSTRRVQNTPLQPFGGSGHVLGTGNKGANDDSKSKTGTSSNTSTPGSAPTRSAFLDRLEQSAIDAE